MEKYLRMSGHFVGKVSINTDGQICDDKYFRGSTDIAEDYYDPICHAINSHDELVAMNKELLAIIYGVIEAPRALGDIAESSDFSDGYMQCSRDTSSVVRDSVEKIMAKGTA